ncbi:SDR family NAD(P)-dependent oxidoreductase [Brachybacterium fresconis]|uniref:NAD(P)-dependent dehydrogenase (Short-subunit alcohol dehydrogenase family) n=1 Tax=Brachybacterium fresconis TaxID=173363 RepID=A0ABS4YLL2_9MICO|nr:SDR family oxidoreductase [Brachybacterium fresconis]MBP2409696.1 NAD(P)-dependent dehydrogenase (short-subunit alcohol dehydrogenase family) [Brachybacterium fresconis]
MTAATDLEFAGLTALVTGGGAGIGAATIEALRTRGAATAALDLDPSGAPAGAVQIQVDVTDSAAVQAAVDRAAAELGGIDIVINNAGIGAQGQVEANDDAEWARVLDVNVVSVARVTTAALPHLRRSQAAAVVNTASIASMLGLPERVLYSASKGAVQAMTLAMAADWVAEGIRVNAVVPGTANTPWIGRLLEKAEDPAAERAALNARQPHGRLVEPEEVAEAHCYLASPRNRSTTGVLLPIDGGMTSLRTRS